ncbi:MAG: HNH endonuclease family protein [Terriglobales bacterium]
MPTSISTASRNYPKPKCTRCYLVVVATPDLDSAYRIFSVLNSRGLDLAPTDILKSEIIGGIPAIQRDAYTTKWEDAEEDLGRDEFTDLFSHIRMIYRRLKPKGTLIKEFKDHVTEVKQPAQFIDHVLLPMTRAYEEILDASYESTSHAEAVNEHLRWLNRLEFNDWVPPALAFTTRHRQEPEAMAAFFRDLERLAYALLIRKAGINDRIERFSKLTAAIDKGADLAEDLSPLQLTRTEQYEVYVRLDGVFYETFAARARTTILLRLDTLLSGGGAKYDYKTITVEHVLPQTPPDGSKWLTWFPTPNDRFQWVHRLGNLALLTRKKNSSASNYEFDKKKQSYFAQGGVSPFVLTTQVRDKNEWTPAIVAERQKQLLAILENHWQLKNRKNPQAASA